MSGRWMKVGDRKGVESRGEMEMWNIVQVILITLTYFVRSFLVKMYVQFLVFSLTSDLPPDNSQHKSIK